MRDKDLCNFIKERERVRMAKEAGKKPPWTKDAILATYRFCNVHREDDAVTRWIAKNWRDPNAGMDDLWFAMVVARVFNLPASLADIGFPLPWNTERVRERARQRLKLRAELGQKNFNAAYIVSTNGLAMDKVDYVVDRVLTPLWEQRKKLRPIAGQTLAEWHAILMQSQGLGSFMAAQVVADMKYVEPLLSASDWHTWAAPGPGSKRGLNRVCERLVDAPWPGQTWLMNLRELHAAVNKRLPHLELHAQDLQNCLCEFDKYERARTGEGRPKQLYQPEVF